MIIAAYVFYKSAGERVYKNIAQPVYSNKSARLARTRNSNTWKGIWKEKNLYAFL